MQKPTTEHLESNPERQTRILASRAMAHEAVRGAALSAKQDYLNPERTRDTMLAAFQSAHLSLAETEQDPYASAMHTACARVNDFVEAQSRLRSLDDKDGQPLTPEEHKLLRELRPVVMEFNAAITETILTGDNRVSFSELVEILTRNYLIMNGQAKNADQAQQFPAHGLIRSTVIGMRTEIGFEDVVDELGLRCERGSDINGDDYWVEGAKFDIKASDLAEKKGQAKAAQHGHNPASVYYPGINFESFDGRLRLPHDAVVAHAERIAARTYQRIALIEAHSSRKRTRSGAA